MDRGKIFPLPISRSSNDPVRKSGSNQSLPETIVPSRGNVSRKIVHTVEQQEGIRRRGKK